MTSGIYRITVKRSGKPDKFYIGQSCNLRTRKATHFRELKNGTSKNPLMQQAFNHYGENAFFFEVLEHVDKDAVKLAIAEKQWLDRQILQTGRDSVYNVFVKEVRSRLGVPHRPDTIEKIRQANSGARTEKQRQATYKMIQGNVGRKLSPETIAKRTAAQAGVKRTAEFKQMLREKMLQRPPMSEEVKEKISNTKKQRNQKPSAEHMEKLREINRTRERDPAHFERLAAMKRGVKKSPEEIARRTETRRKNAEAKGKVY